MNTEANSNAINWRNVTQPAISGFKAYWPAILIIQLCALCIALSYYFIDGASEVFDQISAWKVQGGLFFATITTVISGGIIPELLKRVFRSKGSNAPSAGELAHQFVIWAIIGIWVDFFYQFQGFLFGNETDAQTTLIKVAFDQLVATPLVPIPFFIAGFLLYEVKYDLKAWLKGLSPRNLLQRGLPLWVTSLSFWPVMLLVVYSLPNTLQFPLFLCGNAAFSILMIFILRRQGEA